VRRYQRGASLVELIAVIAIIGVLTGLAAIGARAFIASARRSRATTQVADALALARARAVSKSQLWQVVMVKDVTTGLVRSLLLQTCPLAAGTPATGACTSGWRDDTKGPVTFEPLTGLRLPGSTTTIVILFDRLGQAYRFDDGSRVDAPAALTVCSLRSNTGPCDGGPTRAITIQKYTGVLA
jgi:prepilin-type N-terminal cleavage/methylation domain-containing protein